MEVQQTEEPLLSPKRIHNAARRFLTGLVYVLVLLGCYALKLFVSDLFFDGLLVLFCAFGTFEMLRACKEQLTREEKALVMTFALLTLLVYALSDFAFVYTKSANYAFPLALIVFVCGAGALLGLLVFAHEKTSLQSVGYALMCLVYPTAFLFVLMVCNRMPRYSEVAVLFVFVICPFIDSLALVFGKLLGRRFPAKMAPTVSPKKTIVGGLGGVFGGLVGALAIFFACYGISFLDDVGAVAPLGWQLTLGARDICFFLLLGLLCAVVAQLGDLVESAVKRKIGIKDMGKLLPGHGGILDRIDSSLYAGLVVCLAMTVWLMIGV